VKSAAWLDAMRYRIEAGAGSSDGNVVTVGVARREL
jgi:hypothetical protein